MNLKNLLKVAITAIMSNKWRTFLSTLGIIIGVAAVITMMAIGQGSKDSIRADLQKWASAMQTLKQADYEAIRDGASLITHISPEVTSSGQVIYGAKNTNSTIYGESPDYMIIKLWDIEDGQCFTEEDVRKNAKVCVVGKTVVQELFGDKNANCIGKVVRFKSIPFRIIGVLKGKGYNNWGMDQDNVIIAPYTTVMKRLAAQTHFNSFNLSVMTEDLSNDAIEQVSKILRINHKIKEGGDDDFNIRSQQEMMETMSSTMGTLQTVLVVAAAFSLLVAGIGIMNIMLVSVTERTREIGLRMSVGARGRDISRQFLIESVMISLSGGLLGVGLGYLFTWIAISIGFPATVPLWSVIVSFGVCACIGLVFGLIPARKAARLDPIEALRYE